MTRITKKLEAAQRAFQQRVMAHLLELGAEHPARDGRENAFLLQTPAGPLSITVYGDWIAQRFDDVEAGSLFTRQCCGAASNPYSGKWNFHFPGKEVLRKDCESYWRFCIGELMSIPFPKPFAERLESYLEALKAG